MYGLSCKMWPHADKALSTILISVESWKCPSVCQQAPASILSTAFFWTSGGFSTFGEEETVQSVTGNTHKSVRFSTALRSHIIPNLLLVCVLKCGKVWERVYWRRVATVTLIIKNCSEVTASTRRTDPVCVCVSSQNLSRTPVIFIFCSCSSLLLKYAIKDFALFFYGNTASSLSTISMCGL